MGLFGDLFRRLGGKAYERDLRKQYDPRRRKWTEHGYWKNIGTPVHDNWEWVDLKPGKYKAPKWLNVIEMPEGHYLIKLTDEALPNTEEVVKCGCVRDVEIGVELLKSYYECLGDVIVDVNTEKRTI